MTRPSIDNGFTIIEPSIHFCEFYHFASNPGERSVLNFYFNNINMLYRFIAYFKSEAQSIISFCLKNKIQYISTSNEVADDNSSNNIFADISKTTPITKFYFRPGRLNRNDNYLTKREIDISTWLIQWKTAEEISIILNISKKTVETHIEHIKMKLDCYKQTQLVTQLINIGLERIINIDV